MAVHLGTPTTSFGVGDTIAIPHTTPNNTERVLVVCVAVGPPSAFVSAMTYDGVALTTDDFAWTATNNNGSVELEIWRLADPAVGTHDLVVTIDDPSDYALAAFPVRGVDADSFDTVGHLVANGGEADAAFAGSSFATYAGGLAVLAAATIPSTAVTFDAPAAAVTSLASNGPDPVRLAVASFATDGGFEVYGATFGAAVDFAAMAFAIDDEGADQPDVTNPPAAPAITAALAARARRGWGRGRRG